MALLINHEPPFNKEELKELIYNLEHDFIDIEVVYQPYKILQQYIVENDDYIDFISPYHINMIVSSYKNSHITLKELFKMYTNPFMVNYINFEKLKTCENCRRDTCLKKDRPCNHWINHEMTRRLVKLK